MVSVDQEVCIGCGVCVDMCPEVFTLNSDGKAHCVRNDCDQHNLEEISTACPVEAINV